MIYSVFRILWYDKLLFLKNRLQSYEKKMTYANKKRVEADFLFQ
jgi:hypothetical protein